MGEYNPNDLANEMFQISRLLKEKMSFSSKMVHLSMLQIHTLIFLNQNENVAMSDIADSFHIELPSATSLVNKLFEMKLVERSEDRHDRRIVRISLTDEGIKLMKTVRREQREKIETILSYLPEKERMQLLHILKTLHSKLIE